MSAKCAFSPTNLAILGALDDFFDAYCAIEYIYDNQKIQFMRDTGKEPDVYELNTLAKEDVCDICEPVINKYLYLFTGETSPIIAKTFGFHTFSFFELKSKTKSIFDKNNWRYSSFAEFLSSIHSVVSLIFAKRLQQTSQSKRPLEQLWSEQWNKINTRLEDFASAKLEDCRISCGNRENPTDAVLYLFETLSSTSCYKNNHPVVAARFVADKMDGSGQIILPAHYCNYCKKYFIGVKTLNLFEKNFGKLVIQKRVLTGKESNTFDFRAESLLHQLGYNVIDGNMTERERQYLLVYLLNHKKISYLEICATIEQNIRMFQYSYRHQLAVTKWKDDLRYIGAYVVKEIEFNPQEK